MWDKKKPLTLPAQMCGWVHRSSNIIKYSYKYPLKLLAHSPKPPVFLSSHPHPDPLYLFPLIQSQTTSWTSPHQIRMIKTFIIFTTITSSFFLCCRLDFDCWWWRFGWWIKLSPVRPYLFLYWAIWASPLETFPSISILQLSIRNIRSMAWSKTTQERWPPPALSIVWNSSQIYKY